MVDMADDEALRVLVAAGFAREQIPNEDSAYTLAGERGYVAQQEMLYPFLQQNFALSKAELREVNAEYEQDACECSCY